MLELEVMPNRLAQETSPYLLQHAGNPVEWLPWGVEAFVRARAEQKPIFLSIGYSTCHWCHVMAHESFENAEIAAILNEHFIPIKVDREERPDVDRVYMTYVQAATGHGGWPLSAWLTPELKPFFGGTYFPPDDRYGRPGFPSVLRALANAWQHEREKLMAESSRVTDALRSHLEQRGGGGAGHVGAPDLTEPAGEAFEKAFQFFHENFDELHGGFGGAPKFPRASALNFLFRVAVLQRPDSEMGREAIGMVEVTLQKMARGGLHDHVGGGFHRYSVDEEWFVPHFEKMLYDQAQIATNYLDAYQLTGRAAYAWTARGIFNYVKRDLVAPGGGFYSAEDADSLLAQGRVEHAEGAFYLWTKQEIENVLAERAALFCAHFDVLAAGNVSVERDPHGEFVGKNLLRQCRSLGETARAFSLDVEAASDVLVEALQTLRVARERRPRPHRDDKVITAWNGLMISALARAGQVLRDDELLELGRRGAGFIERELYDAHRNIVYRSFRYACGAAEGFSEDYAFFIQGLLDLYEATFEIRWLRWADKLQQKMDELFWDSKNGGYFNSALGDEAILLRLKEDYDGAEPSPNSVAAANLLRLAPVSGQEQDYRERALRTITAFQPQWSSSPQALPQMLCALELALEPPRQAVLAGDPHSDAFRELAWALHEQPGQRRAIFAADGGEGQAWLAVRCPWLAQMRPVGGRASAYLCEHYTCRLPISDPAALRAQLSRSAVAGDL